MFKNGSARPHIRYMPLDDQQGIRRSHARLARVLLGSVVLLALILGIGLGVGLRHRDDTIKATVITLDHLVNSSQFSLDPAFPVSSEPTVRFYDWTVSKVNATPVGVVKPMVVINGAHSHSMLTSAIA